MHVVDATLFYSPTSGGVKRYLLAKHEWMRAHTNWRHSLVVPGEQQHARARRHLHGRRAAGARRVQLPPAAEPVALVARHRRARARSHRDRRRVSSRVGGGQCRAAAAAFRSSRSITRIFPQLAGRRLGQRRAEVHRVVRAAHLRALRAGARAQPLHVRLPAQHRRRARHLPAAGRRRRHFHSRAAHAAICAAELESAARHAPAGVRRAFLRREEHPGADRGVPPARRALSPAVDRRRRRRAAKAMSRACPIAATTASSPATSRPPMPSCMPARTKPSGWWCSKPWPAAGPVVAMRAGAVPELVDERPGCWPSRTTNPDAAARISPARLPRCTNATWMRSAPRRARHVVANYSWSRALQALMARYQAAVAATAAALASVAWLAPKPRTSYQRLSDPAGPLLQIVLRPLHVFDAVAHAHLVDVVVELLAAAPRRRRSASRSAR